MMVDTN